MKLKKILVANRGEIAARIFATCRELGIQTVAIYSTVDAELAFVHEADFSIRLEGESLSETYLNMVQIITIAKNNAVDAIHPGYGFLSENAEFAERVMKAGIKFIGPSAKNISAMGNKSQSKVFLQPLGIPFIPGYFGKDQSEATMLAEAKKIGLPLLIKAAAGGGGKGMKIVESMDEFSQKLEEAKSEAKKAFNDEQVMLEKYLINPRHIEVQVLGDEKGNARHFFERDCSIQRRHQKIVEEAPAPNLSGAQREALFKDALTIVNKMQYENAGTMEFIMDKDGKHYFLEMNTRLQVEHPVTEKINGIDLVKQQIRVAEGEAEPWKKLGKFEQPNGHALEVRIYAEDPDANFLPTSGKISLLKYAKLKNVRYDFTYQAGDVVTINFDPMIGKLIVWAETRQEAIAKMISALKETVIMGFKTNIGFLIQCLSHPEFAKGNVSTNFIPNFLSKEDTSNKIDAETIPVLATYFAANGQSRIDEKINDPWGRLSGFRI